MSCIVAGATPEMERSCARFARRLGTAFQIVDDVLDYSRSADWRKKAEEDLESRKLTLVLCRALRNLSPPGRRRLGEIIGAPRGDSGPAALERASALVRESGALAECREIARQNLGSAWKAFSRRLASSQSKIMLKTLCQNLIDLDFGA